MANSNKENLNKLASSKKAPATTLASKKPAPTTSVKKPVPTSSSTQVKKTTPATTVKTAPSSTSTAKKPAPTTTPKKTAQPKKKSAKKRNIVSRICVVAGCFFCAGIFFLCSWLFLLEKNGGIRNLQSTYSSQADYDFTFPYYDDSQILGQVAHTKPQVFGDHQKEYYPSYTNKITDLTSEKKQSLYDENMKILEDTPNAINENRLKKHISADGQFYGTISDDAPRIIKKVTINHNVQRRHSLGVFAPAGEVLTVKIDESLVDKNLSVIVGYPYVENNVFSEAKFSVMVNSRMPYMTVSFKLSSTETKIGSPFGGMVILDSLGSTTDNFDITISGGVDSPDYQLGKTTKQQWQEIKKAPGLYVWCISPYIVHVVPKAYVQNIDDPYNAMMFWHKSAMLSLYTIGRDSFNTPVINVYDDYIPTAGAGAVAFVFAWFSVLPSSWGTSALNYDSIMYSGNWGNLHEFNHHNQTNNYNSRPWGIGENGEVTNNVLNALSYIQYSQIATNRTDTVPPTGSMGAWEVVTDGYYNYSKLLLENAKVDNFEKLGTNKLFAYIDLVHNFGVEKFVDFVRTMYGLGELEVENSLMTSSDLKDANNFAILASKYFERDFTDYFIDVWKLDLTEQTIAQIRNMNYQKFFTLHNVYSVGVKGVEAGRPYTVNVGAENILDLKGKTLCSADSFEIKSVSHPKGTLKKLEDGKYSYTMPDGQTEDEFVVKYSCKIAGKTYTQDMVIKLVANVHYAEKTTYALEDAKLTIFDAIEKADSLEETSSVTTKNLSGGVETGVNLTKIRAKIMFPEDKKLNFIVYGDDKTYLKIGEQEAYTTTYIGSLNEAKKQTTNKIEVTFEKDQLVELEAYCYNIGGAGGLYIMYSEDGETYTNLETEYLYYPNAENVQYEKKETPVLPTLIDISDDYLNLSYSDAINMSKFIKSIAVQTPDGEEVLVTDGSKTENMFDGNFNTHYHTAWEHKITPMPHEYIIEFEESVVFNNFTVYFWTNGSNVPKGYYAMNEFELYKSDDGESYEKFYEGTNSENIVNLNFDENYQTNFVKLVIKSNALEKNYTAITEIQFNQKNIYENFNIMPSADKTLIYQDEWQETSGMFLNGKAAFSKAGTVQFVLDGEDLTLYSLNDESKIFIDGKQYTIFQNANGNSPSFVIDKLSKGKHLVKIEANNMTFNGIKTSGEISSVNDFGSGYLSMTVVIILTCLLLAILLVSALLLQNYILKRKNK